MKKKWIVYTLAVYAVSAIYSLLYLLFPYKQPAGMAVTVGYMFLPLIVSLVLQLMVYKEPVQAIGIFFKLNKWILLAVFLPLIISVLAGAASLLFPGVIFTTDMSGMLERMAGQVEEVKLEQMKAAMASMTPMFIFGMTMLQIIIMGATVNAVAAFGEEAGWRGFLFRETNEMGFYKGALLTGLIWGVWHAPVILQGHNYPDHPFIGVFMMIGFTVLLSPIMSYIRLKTGSVLGAAVAHGVINASAGLGIMYSKGGSDLVVGLTGAGGFLALLCINLLILMYDKFIEKEKVIIKL